MIIFIVAESGRMEIEPAEASGARHRTRDGSEAHGAGRSAQSVGSGR